MFCSVSRRECLRFPLSSFFNIAFPSSGSRLSFATSSSSSCSPAQTGILMMNMGGPAQLDDVHDFLLKLFSDTDIIKLPLQHRLGPWIARRRTPSIQQKYSEIGGGSPIHEWTRRQGELMCRQLDIESPSTAPHRHFTAFRYVRPSCEDALREVIDSGVQRLVLFSQYPQYSCATAGSSFNDIYREWVANCSTARLPDNIKLSVIDRWSTNPHLVQCHAQLIRDTLSKVPVQDRSRVVLLFSAHSLPLSAVERGDPYPAEVGATVQAVMNELQHSHPYRLVWQSKVGPAKWLAPATDSAIEALARRGHKHLMLVPITFVNEHIETLHELDIEYAHELGEKVGAKIYRVPAPNDHPLFIAAMCDLVKRSLDRSQAPVSAQLLMTCPMCTNAACSNAKRWLAQRTAH